MATRILPSHTSAAGESIARYRATGPESGVRWRTNRSTHNSLKNPTALVHCPHSSSSSHRIVSLRFLQTHSHVQPQTSIPSKSNYRSSTYSFTSPSTKQQQQCHPSTKPAVPYRLSRHRARLLCPALALALHMVRLRNSRSRVGVRGK